MADFERIAEEIRSAQDSARQIAPITSREGDFDIAGGYAVARINHAARVSAGARPMGRKIGFTNAAIQSQYGVAGPTWAHMYDTTVTRMPASGATFPIGRFSQPRIEPEVVIHFRSPPPVGGSREAILACVDWIAHGFEIVHSPYPDWKFRAADAVAASSLHAALLLGEPQPLERLGANVATALERFTLALSCDGQLRDSGTGANVLGNPLAAIAHLTTELAEQSSPLQAGEMVTTGSITAALLIQPGETWKTEIDGIALPEMSVTFVE